MLHARRQGYDSRAGRSPQQDPIGIAGGANVYGFAGGDPVNFDDPFGLCCSVHLNVSRGLSEAFLRGGLEKAFTSGPKVSAGVTIAGVTASVSDGTGPTFSTSTSPTEVGAGVSLTITAQIFESGTLGSNSINLGVGQHLGITISDSEISLNAGASVGGLPGSISREIVPVTHGVNGVPAVRPDATAVRRTPTPALPRRQTAIRAQP